ncbi:metal-dependent hydrolase [uncultured Methanolobus sp.]|uniref:metal-dependent hydrolase n=1 Tax=uncultured Methanolobus sp. TaxID=218300 RepID=UPI0029C6B968|nr:metal-dependent hydrolase [uncultured Methanolobus sp.]
MLPFAHIGITLAVFYIIAMAFPKIRPHINYWYVIAGSMLPDIIDKIIGRVLFEDVFASGRIFAHTLLFVLVLGMAGYIFFYRKRGSRVLMLAGGCFVHLVLDSMWKTSVTLLWPLLGWQFQKGAEYGSFWQYLLVIYRNLGNIDSLDVQSTLMTEILGIVLIMIFGLGYLRQKIIEHSSTN